MLTNRGKQGLLREKMQHNLLIINWKLAVFPTIGMLVLCSSPRRKNLEEMGYKAIGGITDTENSLKVVQTGTP